MYMMNCELLATCSALGYLEGETYHAEPDCIESVKDLIRYLRHEDDTRDIRQQLGAGQILQNDLLPIITQHTADKPLFDACIRLMVNLTQPALLCFGKVPEDPVFRHHFLQVECFLQAYKEAFASEKVFTVFSETLYNLLQLDWEERQEEDNLLIERILLLVRNILHVPANPHEEKNVDDDASVHDRLLWAVHLSGFDDLVKFVAAAQSEQQWSMHVLEIISLMFRDQKPENLVSAGHARSVEEKRRDELELETLRQKEMAERRSRMLQRGVRHSRFGGSYVVQGLKSIGDNDVIYHKGLHNFKNYTHDSGKSVRRVPKRNRKAAEGGDSKRRSALNVRLFLREFCVDFLENCYNRLMYLVKENLIRETAQQHDETYYLWALSFFMAFNRGNGFRADLVSETLSIRSFHYMEKNITNYYEMILMDKKEAGAWSRRMHLALKAYQELLLTVNEMDRSHDPTIRQSSNVIKSNIFYLMEYREIFLTLLRKFDSTKQPRSFLVDLVESTHLFLRMLERFCKGRNNLVVQKKKVKRRRSNKKKSSSEPLTPEALEEIWKTLADELRATGFQLSDGLVESIVPFDPTSETPLEEQRTDAMVRLQDSLRARLGPEALGFLRAAREVWPEGDVFGSSDVEPEEELELLKQILFADLPRSSPPPEPEVDEDEDGSELVEEEMETVQVAETDFNFLDFIKRFAQPNIVQPYLVLLKSYSQNSPHTNHCIVRMLHRLALDLKMDALLFQLSAFHVFNKIHCDPAKDAYKELVTFSQYVLKRFFSLAETNNKAFVELLFWKNVGAVRDMTEGYSNDGDGSKKKASWTPEEEEELQRLYEEHRDSDVPDIVETLLPLLGNERTRRQVVIQLVLMGLVGSAKELKKKQKGTRIVLWTEDQEEELQILHEEFKDSNDVLGNIMKKLTAKRSRPRIVEKLLSMGLVSDRKELYKKRSSAPGGRKSSGKSSGRGTMTEEEFLSGLTQDPMDQEDDPMDQEDDEEEEEEEEESEGGGDEERRGGDEERRRSRKLTSSSSSSVMKRSPDVLVMVRSLQDQEMRGPLLWLQNCLNRTADGREDDGISQPVPLVPFTEDNEDAMENKAFQKLLKKLGIRPPENEQESFWRISAKMSPSQLRGAAAALSPEEEEGGEGVPRTAEGPEEEEEDGGPPGEEGVPGSPSAPAEPLRADHVDAHEQRTQALRALLLARKRKTHTDATDVQPVEETEAHRVPPGSPQEKISAKRSRVLDNEDDDEDAASPALVMDLSNDGGRSDGDSDGETLAAPPKRRRKMALIDDDDDD